MQQYRLGSGDDRKARAFHFNGFVIGLDGYAVATFEGQPVNLPAFFLNDFMSVQIQQVGQPYRGIGRAE
ncbi:hypothetical protein JM49_00840 [Pseudomonas chlororaphis subsp. aurantiaca]|nr:hypothetical protein JM49_00840 [Pseudomonas chlororaphis subsp. aurantiaca]